MNSSRRLVSAFFAALVVAAVGPVSGAAAKAPQIDWKACPSKDYPTLQCGTFKVPYDYNKPKGKQFTLALQKLPASGKSKKIGTLFTNPGGPGAPGLESWVFAAKSQPLRRAFDLVGFDPRGVGDTKPAFDCAPPELPNPANSASVDWVGAAEQAAPLTAKANRACQDKSADFIAHVGTNNVVRDLDGMRAAVGDSKLSYWGMSYGSRIGYVYAYRYPKKVRAMILDGSLAPDDSWARYLDVRLQSNDQALRFIRSVSPVSYAAVIATRDSLFASKLDLGGVELDGNSVMTLFISLLPSQDAWPAIVGLKAIVDQARIVGPDGAEDRALLRSMLGVTGAEPAAGSAITSFYPITCTDFADRPSALEQAQIVRKATSRAPIFGGLVAFGMANACGGFSFRPDLVPSLASKASLARVKNVKVVISDSTADADAPLVWGRAMARAFSSSAEVTMATANHVNFLRTKSECVNAPLRLYLLTLKMPPRRTACPFIAPAGLDMGAAAARKGKVDPKEVADSLIRSYRLSHPLAR